MKLELARQNDFETIIAFYDDVMERTPEMGTYARWRRHNQPPSRLPLPHIIEDISNHALTVNIGFVF